MRRTPHTSHDTQTVDTSDMLAFMTGGPDPHGQGGLNGTWHQSLTGLLGHEPRNNDFGTIRQHITRHLPELGKLHFPWKDLAALEEKTGITNPAESAQMRADVARDWYAKTAQKMGLSGKVNLPKMDTATPDAKADMRLKPVELEARTALLLVADAPLLNERDTQTVTKAIEGLTGQRISSPEDYERLRESASKTLKQAHPRLREIGFHRADMHKQADKGQSMQGYVDDWAKQAGDRIALPDRLTLTPAPEQQKPESMVTRARHSIKRALGF